MFEHDKVQGHHHIQVEKYYYYLFPIDWLINLHLVLLKQVYHLVQLNIFVVYFLLRKIVHLCPAILFRVVITPNGPMAVK